MTRSMRYAMAILPTLWMTALAGENLLVNPSFEREDGEGKTTEWHWGADRAKATLTRNATVARSGACSLKIVNETAQSPHVYSTLTQTVRVAAETTYTLSCYVKTMDGGAAWIGGGATWQWRFPFPAKAEDWQRVTGTFKTERGEDSFTVRILTESPTTGIWLDDVKLEVGDAASEFVYIRPLDPGQSQLRVTPITIGPNLVPNSSFETVDGVRPKGWMWDQRNTDATLTIDRDTVHSGSVSVKITNGTPFGAHVYGWFGIVGGIVVKPDTAYTVSAQVRSDSNAIAWFGGGSGWKVRVRIPNTRGTWEQVSRVFTTGAEETTFPLMVVSENPTPGFWIDDITLREGAMSVPANIDSSNPQDTIRAGAEEPERADYRGGLVETRWAPSLYPPTEWAFCTDVFRASGCVTRADAQTDATVEVALENEQGTIITRDRAPLPEGAHILALDLCANLGEIPSPSLVVVSRLLRGDTVLAQHRGTVNLVTRARVEQRLNGVEASQNRLRPLVETLEARGFGAYQRVTLTVLENAVPWARADLSNDRSDRAWDAASTMADMAAQAIAEAEAVLTGKRPGLPVPRYKTSQLRIEGPSFIGTRAIPNGATDSGPVFFTGYGHFGQVRRDIEKFPGYGCNACQIEFGPRSVVVEEDRLDDRAIDDFLSVCDRAAKAGVSVNLLLSPHYFPNWALDKWPHLRECGGGFFRYCVHAPEARQVIEAFLRHVIPRIKDHPALHSLCLSNEPISTDLANCGFVRDGWHAWLKERHGTIAELNRRWGSAHATFADIAVPAPVAKSAEGVDFVRFNQETFAAFHAWMADVIHDMAPSIPVHAKIMMGAHFGAQAHGIWSVSPELFGDLSQIHGNDCSCMFSAQGDWINGWQMHQMAYDFQRSMGDKPVFNSENHVIIDRDHRKIPAGHLTSVLWQGALHGQSATTIWVWERTYDHMSSVEGSVIHRPDCIDAVGRCTLDLNRLAGEMTALQNQPPQILLFWSQASVLQGDQHGYALQRCYRSANFLGVPIGFVAERQLEAYAEGGPLPHGLAKGSARVLLVPEVTHCSDSVLKALTKVAATGIQVTTAGECFTSDEYGRRRDDAPAIGTPLAAYSAHEPACFDAFVTSAPAWGLTAALTLTDADGNPAYGVEIRSALMPDGRQVASLCNHRREPLAVTLRRGGQPVASRDLRHACDLDPAFTVAPLTPLMVEVR